jgi:hypothetical protein
LWPVPLRPVHTTATSKSNQRRARPSVQARAAIRSRTVAAAKVRKHLPLIAAAVFLALVQICSTYWFTRRPDPVVDELIQLRLDVNDGVIYARFNRDVTVGLTPHAALQTQRELGRMITEIERKAAQVH